MNPSPENSVVPQIIPSAWLIGFDQFGYYIEVEDWRTNKKRVEICFALTVG